MGSKVRDAKGRAVDVPGAVSVGGRGEKDKKRWLWSKIRLY